VLVLLGFGEESCDVFNRLSMAQLLPQLMFLRLSFLSFSL
jgi:hypothetical protein